MVLNHSTGKMCIPEVLVFLGADRPFEGSVQMADSDATQDHTYLAIPSNRLSRAVCLANQIPQVSQLTQLGTYLSPIGKC